MMRPIMRRQLQLETEEALPDGAGGVTVSWTPLGKIWAEVEATGGRERGSGDLPVSQVTHRIIVRAAPTGAPSRPTARQRFRDGQRIFRITAVHEADARGRYLMCRAVEEVTV